MFGRTFPTSPAAQATYDRMSQGTPDTICRGGLGDLYAKGYYGKPYPKSYSKELAAYGAYMAGVDYAADEKAGLGGPLLVD